jgi:hypothetical protein
MGVVTGCVLANVNWIDADACQAHVELLGPRLDARPATSSHQPTGH